MRVYCKDCPWEHEEPNPILALGIGQRHQDEADGDHTVVTSLGEAFGAVDDTVGGEVGGCQ